MVGLVVEDHDGRPVVEVAQDATGEGLGTFGTFVDHGVGLPALDVLRFGQEECQLVISTLPLGSSGRSRAGTRSKAS